MKSKIRMFAVALLAALIGVRTSEHLRRDGYRSLFLLPVLFELYVAVFNATGRNSVRAEIEAFPPGPERDEYLHS